MVCELKAAQNAMLLVRRYVADKADADELLACLKPYGLHLPLGAGAGFRRCISR
jgi:tRNA isopentenyl-2-thiomethyl-A-37 hydroxylase MiaE